MSGNSPLRPTGHRPFGAAAQKGLTIYLGGSDAKYARQGNKNSDTDQLTNRWTERVIELHVRDKKWSKGMKRMDKAGCTAIRSRTDGQEQ